LLDLAVRVLSVGRGTASLAGSIFQNLADLDHSARLPGAQHHRQCQRQHQRGLDGSNAAAAVVDASSLATN
jgi:hypothetical protein